MFECSQINQTLVFDNASTDNTVSAIYEKHPKTKLIASPVNIGYGRAANAAFERINTPYALLLNPDVSLDPAQLAALYKIPNALGNDWLYIAPDTGNVVTELDEPAPLGLKRITHATGCALLFNLENFKKLGGFDPNIFLYYEEMDLSIRAHDIGLKMYYAEHIKIPHYSKQSSAPSQALDNLRDWHFQWSSLYYKRKHRFYRAYWGSLFKNLIASYFKQLITNKRNHEKIKIKRAATIAFLRKKEAFLENGKPYKP